MWTDYEKRVVISTLELVLEHTAQPDFDIQVIVPTPFDPMKPGPIWLEAGICDLIKHILPEDRREPRYLMSLWKRWPNYSGNAHFPVPTPPGCRMSEHGSFLYACAQEMWSPDAAYGALRRDLCTFLIKELSK